MWKIILLSIPFSLFASYNVSDLNWTDLDPDTFVEIGEFKIKASQTSQSQDKKYTWYKGKEIAIYGQKEKSPVEWAKVPILKYKYTVNPTRECKSTEVILEVVGTGTALQISTATNLEDDNIECSALYATGIQRNRVETDDIEMQPYVSWKFSPVTKVDNLEFGAAALMPMLKGISDTTLGFTFMSSLIPHVEGDHKLAYFTVSSDQVSSGDLLAGYDISTIFNDIYFPIPLDLGGDIVLSQDYSKSSGGFSLGLNKLFTLKKDASEDLKAFKVIKGDDTVWTKPDEPDTQESIDAASNPEAPPSSLKQLGGLVKTALTKSQLSFSPITKTLNVETEISGLAIFNDFSADLGFGLKFIKNFPFPNMFKLDIDFPAEVTQATGAWAFPLTKDIGVGITSGSFEITNMADAIAAAVFQEGDKVVGVWPKNLKIKLGLGAAPIDAATAFMDLEKVVGSWPLSLDGSVELTFEDQLGINFNGQAHLFNLLTSYGGIDFKPPLPYVKTYQGINIISGAVDGRLDFTAEYKSGVLVSGKGKLNISVPKFIPLFGGSHLGSLYASANSNIKTNYFKLDAEAGGAIWIIFKINYKVNMTLVRYENGKFYPPAFKIGKGLTNAIVESNFIIFGEGQEEGVVPSENKVKYYVVGKTNKYLLASIICTEDTPKINMTNPQDDIFPSSESLTFNTLHDAVENNASVKPVNFIYNNGNHEVLVLINKPSEGTYTFNIENSAQSGECNYMMAMSDEVPEGSFSHTTLDNPNINSHTTSTFTLDVNDDDSNNVGATLFLGRKKDKNIMASYESYFDAYTQENEIHPVSAGTFRIPVSENISHQILPDNPSDRYADLDNIWSRETVFYNMEEELKINRIPYKFIEEVSISDTVFFDKGESEITIDATIDPKNLQPGIYALYAKIYDNFNTPIIVEYGEPIVIGSTHVDYQPDISLKGTEQGQYITWGLPDEIENEEIYVYANIYLQGSVNGVEPIKIRHLFTKLLKDTEFLLEGLTPNAPYTVSVSFLDKEGHETMKSAPLPFVASTFHNGHTDIVIVHNDTRVKIDDSGNLEGRLRFYNDGTSNFKSGRLKLYYSKVDDSMLFADVLFPEMKVNTYKDVFINVPKNLQMLARLDANITENTPYILVTIEDEIPVDITNYNNVETVKIENLSQFEPIDDITTVLQIPEGYSLITLPVMTEEVTSKALGDTVKVFTYTNTEGWKPYDGILKAGIGYWIDSKVHLDLTLTGKPYLISGITAQSARTVLGSGYEASSAFYKTHFNCNEILTFSYEQKIWIIDPKIIKASAGFVCVQR